MRKDGGASAREDLAQRGPKERESSQRKGKPQGKARSTSSAGPSGAGSTGALGSALLDAMKRR